MIERRQESGSWEVWAALVFVQVFFGVHYVAAKIVFEEISPGAWAVIRIVSAAILLEIWVIATRRPFPRSTREWGALAGFACCGVICNQILFVEGLHRTTPAHSSLINTTIPIWTFVFVFLFRHERMSWKKVTGLILAFSGVLFLQAEGLYVESALWKGDLLTALNSISYGLFLAVSRRYLMTHDPLATTAHVFALGALGITAYGLPDLLRTDPGAVSGSTWLWALFIVLFPTIGSYFLNYWALRRVQSSIVALFIFLQPLVATVLGAVLLGFWPRWPFYLAASLVFLGVGLAVHRARVPRSKGA